MNEFEQELDDLIDRLDKVLTKNDMTILRIACGKAPKCFAFKQPHEVLQNTFDDFNKIFSGVKK
jgi:hypothetical protein